MNQEYKVEYFTPDDTDTITITGRAGRIITVVNMLVNGTGTETVDATIVYNTDQGDAITCKALAQVTSAAGAPTLVLFNEDATPTITVPIVIKEDETLVLTCSSDGGGGGAMSFAVTELIQHI